MKIFKKLKKSKRMLVFLAIVTAGALALNYFAPQILGDQLVQKKDQVFSSTLFDQDTLSEHIAQAQSQLSTLTQRGKTVADHTGAVLGESVAVSDEEKPLHEKALEYGRYLYCQQVVEEYQQTQVQNQEQTQNQRQEDAQ